MADRDIERSFRHGYSGFYNVSVSIVCFGHIGMGRGVSGIAHFIHCPKYFFEQFLLGIVYGCDFLGSIRVSGSLYCIDRQHLRPDNTGAGHFQHIMGVAVFNFIQLVLILLIDLPHNRLHGLACAGVLTRKENPKGRAGNQSNQADHDYHNRSHPAACNNGGNQGLCYGNNRFYCRNSRLRRFLCGGHSRPHRHTSCLCSSAGSFDRSLRRLPSGLFGLLGCFNSGPTCCPGSFYRF